jgi:hypothetical protein
MGYCEIAFALIVPAIKLKDFIDSVMEQAVPLPTDNVGARSALFSVCSVKLMIVLSLLVLLF